MFPKHIYKMEKYCFAEELSNAVSLQVEMFDFNLHRAKCSGASCLYKQFFKIIFYSSS